MTEEEIIAFVNARKHHMKTNLNKKNSAIGLILFLLAMAFFFALLSGCSRFTIPFDGLNIGAQDATNPCHDEDPCTIDVVTWKVDPKSHLHYDSVCLNLAVDSCIMFCDTADCDDRTFCTDDWCDTVRQICQQQYACNDNDDCTTDDCAGLYCIYEPVNCYDSDLCTNDFCLTGICQHLSVNCNDGNPCTMDACVPQDGQCESVDTCSPPPCDTISDPLYFDPYTGLESYCKLIICGVNTQRSCDDGDPCTNDYCLEGYRMCMNSDVNCDDGTDCVNTGMCWCYDGYCIYGSGKIIPVDEVRRIQQEQLIVTEMLLFSIDGKLLEVIYPDRIKEFAMMFVHSDYPSGMYLLKSGSRTTKLIKP